MIHATPEATATQDVRLLDERGCLTYGAMAFVEQLEPEQQRVVARHVSSCSACAQQQLLLRLGEDLVRRNGPRIAVPIEVRQAARQAVARSLQSQRYSEPPRRRRWSLHRWVRRFPALAGAVIAIAAACAGLLIARLFG